MTIAKLYCRSVLGIEAKQVLVEVHLSKGLPTFALVGLPETSVKEAKERVRSAIINSHFTWPNNKRIIVNLAPANLSKEGGRFDLAIALAILIASDQLPAEPLEHFECIAELALSGELRPVDALIPCALAANKKNRCLLICRANQDEVALTGNPALVAQSLTQVCAFILGKIELHCVVGKKYQDKCSSIDISDVLGQQQAKRVLEIAATGQHNLLLIGPPGTGKSMLAERFMTLLPRLSSQQALQTATLYSVCALVRENWYQPPFRAPHHSASLMALVGGGTRPKPGEISLAHNGVLFLDELAEFPRAVLDSLRQPLETQKVSISRVLQQVTFPANFQLIAAMNPSPCGFISGDKRRSTPDQILRYLGRLSGPFLDRFALSIMVPLLPSGILAESQMGQPTNNESSMQIQARVKIARKIQMQRQGKLNNALSVQELALFCQLSPKDALFLEGALDKMGLSIRAWHSLLKVSRSIADLHNSDSIRREHLCEALNYRSMDRLLKSVLDG